jgi:DNA-binding NtrC family response regulator
MEPVIIFYADDDEDDLHIFKESLHQTQVPHSLKLFKDGKTLLSELKNCNYACDVVFTDLNMPGCNGVEILSSLQGPILKDGLRVVVMSTSNALSDIQKIYELNAALFIQKMSNIRKFIKVLNSVLRYKLYNCLPENCESLIFSPKCISD